MEIEKKMGNNRINDDELNKVSGGAEQVADSGNTVMHTCPNCSTDKKVPFKLASGGRATCTVCGQQIFL